MQLGDPRVMRVDEFYSYERISLTIGDKSWHVEEALPLQTIRNPEHGHKYLHFYHNRMRNAVTSAAISDLYPE